jgi:hypothetical protein
MVRILELILLFVQVLLIFYLVYGAILLVFRVATRTPVSWRDFVHWRKRRELAVAMALNPVALAFWRTLVRGRPLHGALVHVDWFYVQMMGVFAVAVWLYDSFKAAREA